MRTTKLPSTASSAPKRKLSRPPGDMTFDHRPGSPPHTPLSVADHPDEFPTSVLPSSFRNVSSCNRCRLRKTRCDQRLPRCQSCEKVGARCVGYDPITKREIPRSYVYFLECRVNYLKRVLIDNRIGFKPASAFDDEMLRPESAPDVAAEIKDDQLKDASVKPISLKSPESHPDLDRDTQPESLVSDLLSGRGSNGDMTPSRESVLYTATDSTRRTLRESFATFQGEPNTDGSVLPDRGSAEKLINFYFEYASPVLPALNRVDFMDLFDRTYSTEDRSPRSLYFLYIVFAIGTGIVCEDGSAPESQDLPSRATKRRRLSDHHSQPKDYHATAIKYLQSSLNSTDRLTRLEELQAVLLLAHFSLLQPVAPGPARLVEVATRTTVDLGLYYEDEGLDLMAECQPFLGVTNNRRPRELRRRLWWCVYSLDRLVAPYIGRPFSVPDQIITTAFPSFLDGRAAARPCISPDGPNSKHITNHYFKLRLLQSEIHEVLQWQRAQHIRQSDKGSLTRVNRSSSFLHDFDSFGSWRKDMNRRLDDWKSGIPEQKKSGACFPVVLLELDYWQTINQLYRQSLKVPSELVGDLPLGNDIRCSIEDDAEWEDFVHLKVSESSQKVLQIYRLMHHVRLVNYTFLATHSIFLAGSLFLFTIWNSPLIRSQITLNEIDYTLLAGTTVLADMMDKYSHAEACRDSLERMGISTVQMCLSKTDFGSRVGTPSPALPKKAAPSNNPLSSIPVRHVQQWKTPPSAAARRKRPLPQFDMNLEDIFNETIPITKFPPEPSSYAQTTTSLNTLLPDQQQQQRPRLPPPQPQLQQQSEYPESNLPEPPLSLFNNNNASTSATTNTLQTNSPFSLDFLEFDFGDSNPVASDPPQLEQTKKQPDPSSLGSTKRSGASSSSNLGLGIPVDGQQEVVARNDEYDFLDAFLLV